MGMDCTACIWDNAYVWVQAIHIFMNPRVDETFQPLLLYIPQQQNPLV